jgi:hypothetical protein
MKNKYILSVATAIIAAATASQAQVIAGWDFDAGGTVAAPDNTPAATSGSGTASVLGMNNTYNSTTSTADADVLASAGASTGSGSYGWRVRGTPGNGWSSQAPIASQGAEFTPATGSSGYNSITVSVDIDTTAQAEGRLAIEYTLNDTAVTPVWELATITSAGTVATGTPGSIQIGSDANIVAGNYVQLSTTAGWNNLITASLGADADNDPNLAVEIVNATTGADDLNVAGTAYNNSSGNWRYDNVNIDGTPTAVPEPTSLALISMGAAGVFACRKVRKA